MSPAMELDPVFGQVDRMLSAGYNISDKESNKNLGIFVEVM